MVAESGKKAGTYTVDKNCGMSWMAMFQFSYADRFIPIMKKLADNFGHEAFLTALQDASSEVLTGRIASNRPENNDLAAFVRPFKEQGGFFQHILEYDIIEDGNEVFEIRVARCLWASTFCQTNSAEIGHAVFCHPDADACRAFNPKLAFTNTRNLMRGADCCTCRWEMED
jgi:hypothetical protein